jgi:SAM-dependent methyltransferase
VNKNKLISGFQFACPICRTPLNLYAENAFRCPQDGTEFPRVDNIWRFLRPDREKHFKQFIHEYETIRREEGRCSDDPDYYRSLPYPDDSWPRSEEWSIRAKSFEALTREVIEPMEKLYGQSLKILDLGAGNGWLSNCLAIREHEVAAVDLITNSYDGLGAHRYYENAYLPIQSEFNRLPFDGSQFNLAIFNASFHYAERYEETLEEVLRILSPESKVVILDTPVYQDAASGTLMVREREETFKRLYGFPSNAIQSENYLTYQRLKQLAYDLDLNWKMVRPFYGWRWELRPLKARLLGNREPAKFVLVVGEKTT